MRTVLAIETSSRTARIAVIRGGEVLVEEQCCSGRSHNARIFRPLARALSVATPDVIAIGTGPGSYTGIRVGISAATGIAAVKQVPVVGLSSLLVLEGADGKDSLDLFVVGDARRGQVWVATVRSGELVEMPEPMSPDEARARLEGMAEDRIVTPDAEMPGEGIGGRLVSPSAVLLGQRVSGCTDAELARLAAVPVLPIYLAPPFVTRSRKPGK